MTSDELMNCCRTLVGDADWISNDALADRVAEIELAVKTDVHQELELHQVTEAVELLGTLLQRLRREVRGRRRRYAAGVAAAVPTTTAVGLILKFATMPPAVMVPLVILLLLLVLYGAYCAARMVPADDIKEDTIPALEDAVDALVEVARRLRAPDDKQAALPPGSSAPRQLGPRSTIRRPKEDDDVG